MVDTEHLDIRVLESDDHLRAASAVFRTAMVGLPAQPAEYVEQIPSLREPGTVTGAFDDDRIVGTAEWSAGEMRVPGGTLVPHAAVTRVGVLPEFTRRGIVSGLLTRQIHDLAERGVVLASLRASEATIYGRFGYGVATRSSRIELATARATLREGTPSGGPVRGVPVEQSWDLVRGIVATHPLARAGHISRPKGWWESSRIHTDAGAGPNYVAVHGEQGSENGFARFHPTNTQSWFGGSRRTVVVDDFYAPTVDAYAGLIRFLLRLDLVDVLVFASLPVDDVLPDLVIDRRAARVTSTEDETWLRIVDVHAALGARTYANDTAVTLAVTDTVREANSGSYAVSAHGVARTDAEPDIDVGVADLATVLLGDNTWRRLATIGAVAGSDVAVAAADRLFATGAAPHCGHGF